MAKTDGDDPLSGHVEADETYVGGKRPGKRGRGASGKTVVFGVHERGGNVLTAVVPNVKRKTLEAVILEKVAEGSTISTDELHSYRALKGYGYAHGTVNHSAGEYVNRSIHVNSLEGFWSRLKNSIRGTHIHVSPKHLSSYLREFEFRWNLRKHPELMFPKLILSF
jgi:transposase-like protein